MPKNNILKVQDIEISITCINDTDYICLTDMAKAKEDDSRAADIIKNWNSKLFCLLCKLRRQHADSRAYLDNAGGFVCAAGLRHSRADGRIYQKVLAERL